ncbi:MAG TPA: XRE family transcriptional regulator [Allosphingosinicella sp.]|nr:XRE family transcriptional regulator [Allosphingosinicella sp.]
MLSRNTQRIIPVNTPCISGFATLRIMASRKDIMAERLREARQDAGYGTVAAAAEAFGWSPATLTSHENGTRGFDVDAAIRYARAFRRQPGWLLGLDHIEAPQHGPVGAYTVVRKIPLLGTVAAGIWREASVLDADEPEEIDFTALTGDEGEEMFAVNLEGQSMNLTLPTASTLICRRIGFGRIEARPGELVIVQRQSHDLVELTCKRLALVEGQYVLLSESDRPEFQKPIVLGAPDLEHAADEETRVIGVVRRAILASFPPPASSAGTLQ